MEAEFNGGDIYSRWTLGILAETLSHFRQSQPKFGKAQERPMLGE